MGMAFGAMADLVEKARKKRGEKPTIKTTYAIIKTTTTGTFRRYPRSSGFAFRVGVRIRVRRNSSRRQEKGGNR